MELGYLILNWLFIVWIMYNWRIEINKRQKSDDNASKWFECYEKVANRLIKEERKANKLKDENNILRSELDHYKKS